MPHPSTKATREHWDKQAPTYDRAKERNAAYYRPLKALFDQAVRPAFRERVLDVGCGTGELLASLQPKIGLGVDISERMIERARCRFAGCANLSFRVTDASDIATLGPFDAVVSADVLEHVPSWAAVLNAMVLACRPGGLIVISTPNPRWAFPLWILENCHLKMPEGPHKFVPARAIASQLAEDGCPIRHLGTHLMLPVGLAGLGVWASDWAERLPVLRHWGVIQLVVAQTTSAGRQRTAYPPPLPLPTALRFPNDPTTAGALRVSGSVLSRFAL